MIDISSLNVSSIESTHFMFAIILMALITFSVRYVFFSTMFEIKLNNSIKNILLFTAPCILTAMFIPIMFQDVLTQETQNTVAGANLSASSLNMLAMSLLSSSYFWGGVCAIIYSLLIRNTLVIILLSMLTFYGLRYFI